MNVMKKRNKTNTKEKEWKKKRMMATTQIANICICNNNHTWLKNRVSISSYTIIFNSKLHTASKKYERINKKMASIYKKKKYTKQMKRKRVRHSRIMMIQALLLQIMRTLQLNICIIQSRTKHWIHLY